MDPTFPRKSKSRLNTSLYQSQNGIPFDDVIPKPESDFHSESDNDSDESDYKSRKPTCSTNTAQKMKFSIKDFFSKCD